jgi:hypothetical protein
LAVHQDLEEALVEGVVIVIIVVVIFTMGTITDGTRIRRREVTTRCKIGKGIVGIIGIIRIIVAVFIVIVAATTTAFYFPITT